MIDPSEITAARLALGRLLAKYRKAAGLNQYQLAPHTHYGRSTIANVEVGRQNVPAISGGSVTGCSTPAGGCSRPPIVWRIWFDASARRQPSSLMRPLAGRAVVG